MHYSVFVFFLLKNEMFNPEFETCTEKRGPTVVSDFSDFVCSMVFCVLHPDLVWFISMGFILVGFVQVLRIE